MGHHLESSSVGIVDPAGLHGALQKVRQNQEVPIVPLMRAIGIEIWLQKLKECRLLNVTASTGNVHRLQVEAAILPNKWKAQQN
jgi:hypothetical protein